MKILIGTGGSQPNRCTSKCFVKAARAAGHEVVIAGPIYGRNDLGSENEYVTDVDIDLPDKPFPETYSYEQVLERCPWTPDLILQIEPHFYFTGTRPKDMLSLTWLLDPHRNGLVTQDALLQGHFDALLITQPFFAEAYAHERTYFLPQALDTDRIKYYPDVNPECDIAFVGETGLHPDILEYDQYDRDGFAYCDKLPDPISLRSEHREYAERAQLIGYLMEDFHVRLYAPQTGLGYAKIIQRGEIGFHRSLFNDLALRPFEIAACHRAVIADFVPYLDQIFTHGENAVFYKQFGFNPFLDNFKFDYAQARAAVEYSLNNANRFTMEEHGFTHIHKNHTYKNRVERVIEIYEEIKNER